MALHTSEGLQRVMPQQPHKRSHQGLIMLITRTSSRKLGRLFMMQSKMESTIFFVSALGSKWTSVHQHMAWGRYFWQGTWWGTKYVLQTLRYSEVNALCS